MGQLVTLDSLENILFKITTFIATANKKTDEHNTIIENISNEKAILTSQIWRFIVEELSSDITDYNKKKKELDATIENLTRKIQEKNNEKREKELELNNLEKQTTSIIPTRDGVNALLSSF
jgi:wobble nucleotide-excising tRNase